MTATAPTPPQVDEGDSHRTLLWIVGLVVLVLCVIGLITYGAQKTDQESQQKAATLTHAFRQAGLPVPVSQETITRQLGADGGAVCHDPASALGRGILFSELTNGASFVGRRPIIADTDILKGELLILQVYCPSQVQAYKDKIKLKTDDTVKD